MPHYNTILHQLLTLIPRHQFEGLVRTLDNDRYVKRFTSWNQMTTMLYAQASGKDSLRDIQNGLLAQSGRLYHLGLPVKVARSTLSDANSTRDYRLFEKLFYQMLDRCKSITPKHKFRFKNPLYSMDSTSIEMCLSVFPWAKYQRTKGAIKLHYQLDHAGHLPVFMTMTTGKVNDIIVARSDFPIIPDSIYCHDRGYLDFKWFRRIHDDKAFFVTRARKNIAYYVSGQQKVVKNKGVLRDAAITLTKFYSHREYPYRLRLIRYNDPESNRTFEFLTNNFSLAAETIAQIYKARWQIETFFKWIKQNLKVKAFLGTSRNAVLSQIWIAMIYYLILAYIKYQSKYQASLHYLHRIIKATILTRVSIFDLLNLNDSRLAKIKGKDPQLCLQI